MKRTYTLSKIMKAAWAMYTGKNGYSKAYSMNFATCLHYAWEQAKNGCFDEPKKSSPKAQETDKAINGIVAWFLNKNFTSNERVLIQQSEITAIKETAKAYFIKAVSDLGTIKTWVPKSVCI